MRGDEAFGYTARLIERLPHITVPATACSTTVPRSELGIKVQAPDAICCTLAVTLPKVKKFSKVSGLVY